MDSVPLHLRFKKIQMKDSFRCIAFFLLSFHLHSYYGSHLGPDFVQGPVECQHFFFSKTSPSLSFTRFLLLVVISKQLRNHLCYRIQIEIKHEK